MTTAKKPLAVRLSDEGHRLLDLLAKKEFGTQTEAVETAIRTLAAKHKIQ